jgi:hypothetical protein
MEVLMAEWANLVFHNIMVDGTAILLVCHVIANKMITRVIVNKKKYKICKTKKFFLKKKKKKKNSSAHGGGHAPLQYWGDPSNHP